jgi:hypothetical protein
MMMYMMMSMSSGCGLSPFLCRDTALFLRLAAVQPGPSRVTENHRQALTQFTPASMDVSAKNVGTLDHVQMLVNFFQRTANGSGRVLYQMFKKKHSPSFTSCFDFFALHSQAHNFDSLEISHKCIEMHLRHPWIWHLGFPPWNLEKHPMDFSILGS